MALALASKVQALALRAALAIFGITFKGIKKIIKLIIVIIIINQ